MKGFKKRRKPRAARRKRETTYSCDSAIYVHLRDLGGNDTGPNAHELLMASLGACTNTTVQMYAERHQWPLTGVHAVLSYARVLAENPVDSDAKSGMVDRIELEISFAENLSEKQQQRLLEIAGRCPVHRLLVPKIQIDTRLLVSDSRHS